MRRFWLRLSRWLIAARQLRSVADAWLCLRIFLFAAVVPVLLRLKPGRWQALLEARKARRAPDPAVAEKVISYVQSVLRARLPFVRRVCLTRGITLYYFLRGEGLDVSICFGVGEVRGKFVGHCWLIKDGEPFLEKKAPRIFFTEMLRIPQHLTGSVHSPADVYVANA